MKMMFAPRRIIPMVPPEPAHKDMPFYGVGNLVSNFEVGPPPVPPPFEPPIDRQKRIQAEKLADHKEKMELLASSWDPHANSQATGWALTPNIFYINQI